MQRPLYAKSFITGEEHLSCIDSCFPQIDFFNNAVVIYAGFVNQNLINPDDETIIKIRRDLLAVVNEVERLSKKTQSDWEAWQQAAKPIVDFNHKIFTLKKRFVWRQR